MSKEKEHTAASGETAPPPVSLSAARVRVVFRNYLKALPDWDRKTVDLDYSDEEIEKRVGLAVKSMKDIKLTQVTDAFITELIKAIFSGEILAARRIPDTHWQAYKKRINREASRAGVKLDESDVKRFQKAVDDLTAEAGKDEAKPQASKATQAPQAREAPTAKDVYRSYACEVIRRLATDPPSLARLVFHGYALLAKAIDKLTVRELPLLEHTIEMCLAEARMSLVLPPEAVQSMLQKAETAFAHCYNARNSVIVHRSEDDPTFDRKKLDERVLQFMKEKEKKEEEKKR